MEILQTNQFFIELENYINDNKHDDTFFISDWDMNVDEFYSIDKIINDSLNKSKIDMFKYFPIDDSYSKIKQLILNNLDNSMKEENLILSTNGTSVIFTILSLFSKQYNNYLLLTPAYFLYPDILEYYNKNVFYMDSYEILNRKYKEFINKIKQNKIEVIIVTDPIFSIGYSIPNDILLEMFEITNNLDVWLIIDGVYSNLEWRKKSSLLSYSKIASLRYNEKTIFIDSLPKRLGVNGNKFVLVFANSFISMKIQNFQLYTIGSFTSPQIHFIEECYNKDNLSFILSKIDNMKEKARETYNLLITLLQGTNLNILEANSGYFACIQIPRNIFNSDNDINISKKLISDCHIFTLPMSLYHFDDDKYYIFRINLLQNKASILNSISHLIAYIEKR